MKVPSRTLKRFALVALASVVLLTGVTATVFLHGNPNAARAESSNNAVLFIHGFDDPCGVWGSATSYMNSSGNQWPGARVTVGYYSWDSNGSCDVDLNSTDSTNGWADTVNQKCGSYYDGANAYQNGAHGTVDQDLRNLGCRLAWYMYVQYAVNFKNVRVVAHSMGGLIIRYALDRVQHNDSAFPPYLYVPVVITMGTPHGGIPVQGVGILCTQAGHSDDSCLQGDEMAGFDDPYHTPNGSNSSEFLQDLKAETSPPSGGTTYTEWTVIGSYCDSDVQFDNATNFPGGPSGIHGTHKIVYVEVPNDAGTQYPLCDPGGFFAYVHDDPQLDYMHDMTTTQYQDASAWYCDGCSGTPAGDQTKQLVHHSLAVMYRNLSLDVPPPPTPTPTATKPPTCSTTTKYYDNQEGAYTDMRGNTWYVYYDLERDTPTGLPCQMRVVVRIFNPGPDGAWSGTAAVWAEKNGGYLSSSFGKVSSSGTYQYHFAWRGPWFSVSSGNYYIEDTEYNGSTAYARASGSFSVSIS